MKIQNGDVMIFNREAQRAGGKRQKAPISARLHSIAGLLKGRSFAGSFEVAGSTYKFSYAPSQGEIAGQKLRLQGRFTVTDARGRTRHSDNARAVLIATQGGVGAAPIRRQILVGGVSDSTASTSGQQQQQAGGVAGTEPKRPDDSSRARPLPEVDSTGPLSFCGVMYFRFEPLDAGRLGVIADLSAVQLNARLAPTDDKGRDAQGIYSAIADALYRDKKDEKLARVAVAELNKYLSQS
jgi:hypothetical protein